MFSRRPLRPATPPNPPVPDLSAADVDALWQARVDEVNRLIGTALCKHPREQWMVDVLLDIYWALAEHRRLPVVPIVPGRAS